MISNTEYVVHSEAFLKAYGYASIFDLLLFLIATFYFLNYFIGRISGSMKDLPMDLVITVYVIVLFPNQFLLNHKVSFDEDEKQFFPISASFKVMYKMAKRNILGAPSKDAVLLMGSSLFVLMAFISIINSNTAPVAIFLLAASALRFLFVATILNSVNTGLPKRYTGLILGISGLMELAVGLLFFASNLVENSYTFPLIIIPTTIILYGLQVVLAWMEKNSIEQRRYKELQLTLEESLSQRDPTFGSIIALLPGVFHRLSTTQRIILAVGFALGLITYALMVVFSNLGIDPVADPIRFFLWLLPLIVATIAVLLIISQTEKARIEISTTFAKLERALENFERSNAKYLSILDEE